MSFRRQEVFDWFYYDAVHTRVDVGVVRKGSSGERTDCFDRSRRVNERSTVLTGVLQTFLSSKRRKGFGTSLKYGIFGSTPQLEKSAM